MKPASPTRGGPRTLSVHNLMYVAVREMSGRLIKTDAATKIGAAKTSRDRPVMLTEAGAQAPLEKARFGKDYGDERDVGGCCRISDG